MNRAARTLGLGLVTATLAASCGQAPLAQVQASNKTAPTWTARFPTSAKGSAQEHFERGVTFMHLFMYLDAAEAFQEAQKAAPDLAMAYWGEALTHYQPIWREYDREKARAVMQRLGATPDARIAKAATDREKAYVATLDVLYGDGDPATQRRAYAEAMEALVLRYPDDNEALAFWAVSRVVQYERTDEDMQERMRTAGIAQEVLRRQPGHLGAARYLMQSVDDPVHADLGLVAAQLTLAAAPDGPEARHVPTHISAQLGRWEELADVNWQAFEVSMAWTAKHGYKLQDLNDHDYGHLLSYAQYGYLQLGKYARARAIIDRARQDFEASGHAPEMGRALSNLLAQYIVETRSADHLNALTQLADSGVARSANVQYAIGLAAASAGNVERAERALSAIDGRSVSNDIMRLEVMAIIAAASNDRPKALGLLKDASAKDTAQAYIHFGPPGPYKPAAELYGEMLLDASRPEEALKAFTESLRLYRRRTTSLLGTARAATALGDASRAAKYEAELRSIWSAADIDGPTIRVIRASR